MKTKENLNKKGNWDNVEKNEVAVLYDYIKKIVYDITSKNYSWEKVKKVVLYEGRRVELIIWNCNEYTYFLR